MFEKDRQFVTEQVLRVMHDWGVTPSARGTGSGDFENWVDYIIAAKGWEPYWEDTRMPREFTEHGYVKGGSTPQPTPAPTPGAPDYVAILGRIESKIDRIVAKYL